MLFSVLTQVNDTTDMSELEDFIKKMKPPVMNADQTQKHQSYKKAKDHDSETADMIEMEDFSKRQNHK